MSQDSFVTKCEMKFVKKIIFMLYNMTTVTNSLKNISLDSEYTQRKGARKVAASNRLHEVFYHPRPSFFFHGLPPSAFSKNHSFHMGKEEAMMSKYTATQVKISF